jgi:hypothetical protein
MIRTLTSELRERAPPSLLPYLSRAFSGNPLRDVTKGLNAIEEEK